MKKIIVPMDFTEVAMNAFRYANQLFANDQLFIVHANLGIVSTREPIYLQPGKTKEMILKDELAKQICLELGVTDLPARISVDILDGEVIPSISDFVQTNEIEVVVVGTRDKYDFVDRWIGTFSLGLVKTLNIPTYLIPRYAKYHSFEKVLVASDYHLKNQNFVQQIKRWNTRYNAFVNFLHISADENDSFEVEKEAIVKTFVEDSNVTHGFEINAIRDKDISNSLLANAYNYGADLLVAIPDNQSFLTSLLFRSVSKDLILKSNIPLLFLHPEKKKIVNNEDHVYPAKDAKYPNLTL